MWKYTQHSFAGGVQDVRLKGRQDLDRYRIAATTLDNFMVKRQGCVQKRRGTDLIAEVPIAQETDVRVIPFVYERDLGYVLVFSAGEASASIDVYAVNGEGSGTKIVTLTEGVPYRKGDLSDISFVQTGDVIILAHNKYAPHRITRSAGETFTFDEISFARLGATTQVYPPSELSVEPTSNPDASGAERTVYYAATAVMKDGQESVLSNAKAVTYKLPWTDKFLVKITPSGGGRTDTGEKPAYYNIYKKTTGYYGFIASTRSDAEVSASLVINPETGEFEEGKTPPATGTIEDDNITPDQSLTPPTRANFFTAEGDFPSTVSLANQRLVFASTDNEPFGVWWSVVGDLFNFNEHEAIRDDDGFQASLPATEFPRINHIVTTRDTLIFTDAGEWSAGPVSGDTLSVRTLKFNQESQIGSDTALVPIIVDTQVFFAESTGEAVRAIDYNYSRDGYESQNVSILSQSLFDENRIIAWTYAQHPDSTLWCVCKDGTIATLAYMKEHELVAWSRQVLGGGLKAVSVCCTKEVKDGNSAVYILAVNDAGTYLLLRVREEVAPTSLARGLCLDAMRKVTGDGAAVPAGCVAIDALTGDERRYLASGREYYVGYPFRATYRSITPEAQMQGGQTIQFELKDAISAELRLRNVADFNIVPTALEDDKYQDVEYKAGVKAHNGVIALEAKDLTLELAGHSNTSGAITLRCDSPYPLMLLSMSINYELDPRTIGVA